MDKYNMLTVIREVDPFILPSGQKNKALLCKCDCGNEKVIRKLHLVRGKIRSCGCINKTKNGLSTHPLYKVWQSILLRANGHYDDSYRRKNINVCNEWNDYISFYNWAISNGYEKGLQIDRIDSSGNYEPINCRFVTPRENVNNRDNTFFVTYLGNRIAFTYLIESKNLIGHEAAIRTRIKRGWSVEDAFNKNIRSGNYKRKNHS